MAAFIPIWLQKDFGDWTTYGGGGYWINPGPGNRNYWFAGWLLQRQVTKQLALGAEVFHQTASMAGRRRLHRLQPRRPVRLHRPLPPAVLGRPRRPSLRGRRRGVVKYPATYYLAFQYTF